MKCRNQSSTDMIFFVAFILYRQHHQAAVAAQNPGIPNPNISKIIGKQWKSEPASVKGEWKQLAEVSGSPSNLNAVGMLIKPL